MNVSMGKRLIATWVIWPATLGIVLLSIALKDPKEVFSLDRQYSASAENGQAVLRRLEGGKYREINRLPRQPTEDPIVEILRVDPSPVYWKEICEATVLAKTNSGAQLILEVGSTEEQLASN